MSTPLNNLPLKTQTPNDENSDLNDPMVQDVLNEFQEELLMSQKPQQHQMQQPQQHQQQPQQQQQQLSQSLSPPTQQQMNMYQQPIHASHPSLSTPLIPHQQSNMYRNGNNKEDDKPFPYNLINIEILQKTLIILIIIILTYSSNVLPLLYDKLPDCVSDILETYDFFIKSVFIFVTIYILFIMQFI
jgi:hypothetical protein